MIGARRDPGRRDAGVSLVELVVASAVGVLMLSLMATMFVQMTRTLADAQLAKTATGVAWNVMDEVSRVIRQGTRVPTSATVSEGAVIAGSTPTSLIIDTNVDATVAAGQATVSPTRVTFTVSASGNLVEGRRTSTIVGGYAVFGAETTRSVNGPISIVPSGTDALFVYWKGNHDAPVQVVPSTGGLTAAEALTVNAVTVNVTVDRGLGRSDPVRLTNKVTMPNIAILTGGN